MWTAVFLFPPVLRAAVPPDLTGTQVAPFFGNPAMKCEFLVMT